MSIRRRLALWLGADLKPREWACARAVALIEAITEPEQFVAVLEAARRSHEHGLRLGRAAFEREAG